MILRPHAPPFTARWTPSGASDAPAPCPPHEAYNPVRITGVVQACLCAVPSDRYRFPGINLGSAAWWWIVAINCSQTPWARNKGSSSCRNMIKIRHVKL